MCGQDEPRPRVLREIRALGERARPGLIALLRSPRVEVGDDARDAEDDDPDGEVDGHDDREASDESATSRGPSGAAPRACGPECDAHDHEPAPDLDEVFDALEDEISEDPFADEDEEAAEPWSDDDLGRLRALELLRELPPDADAVGACTSLLHEGVPEDLAAAAAETLARWGPPALPAAIAAAREDGLARELLATALVAHEVRDDAAFDFLVECFAEHPVVFASTLGEYGDERALPELRRALAAWRPSPSDDLAYGLDALTLAEAITALGAELTAEEQEKVEHVERRRRRILREADELDRADCACGSGRPLALCHGRPRPGDGGFLAGAGR